ncbi:MAG: hypothetical protein ACM3ZQ_08410 [Bacillota bacterium]
MKRFVVVLLMILVVVVGGGYLLINGKKTVDVIWTEADLNSYLAKGKVTFAENRASVEDIISGNFVAVGMSNVEGRVTSAEITAILNAASRQAGVLRDIRVKFGDGGKVEASAMISDNLELLYQKFPQAKAYESYINTLKGKCVYLKTSLERVDNKKFEAWVDQASIGLAPLPTGQVNTYLTQVGTEINSIISRMNGFSAEQFSFDSSGLYFKGTIPKEIRVAK